LVISVILIWRFSGSAGTSYFVVGNAQQKTAGLIDSELRPPKSVCTKQRAKDFSTRERPEDRDVGSLADRLQAATNPECTNSTTPARAIQAILNGNRQTLARPAIKCAGIAGIPKQIASKGR
jgi:hypothetical protein